MSKYTNEYVIGTLSEAVDLASLEISKNYALDRLAENGVVTQEEVSAMYAIASKILTEGAEDFIPETLELPEDDEPAIAGGDDSMAADLDATAGDDMDGELDISQLEGIILPDAEGNEYTIQNGVIVPYTSGEPDGDETGLDMDGDGMGGEAPAGDAPVDTAVDAATDAPVGDAPVDGGEEAPAGDADADEDEEKKKSVTESSTIEGGDAAPIEESTNVDSASQAPEGEIIAESTNFETYSSNSDIVERLINSISLK